MSLAPDTKCKPHMAVMVQINANGGAAPWSGFVRLEDC